MILTTHAIAGATLATLVPSHPVLGFAVGFASHFVLDSIPHWEYSVKSIHHDEKNWMNSDMTVDKSAIGDFIKIGIDGLIGIALSFALLGIFHPNFLLSIFMGAVGGMAPDALQFTYWNWKHEPLTSLQRFHTWVHPKKSLNDKPFLGILSQVLIICLLVFILK